MSGEPLGRRFQVSYGPITLNLDSDEVWIAGDLSRVKGIHYRLLRYLMLNPERRIGHRELEERVWRARVSPRTVESHLSRLRAAVGCAGPLVVTAPDGCELRAPKPGRSAHGDASATLMRPGKVKSLVERATPHE